MCLLAIVRTVLHAKGKGRTRAYIGRMEAKAAPSGIAMTKGTTQTITERSRGEIVRMGKIGTR